MMSGQPPPDGIVTLRELYMLVDSTRTELRAEVDKTRTELRAEVQAVTQHVDGKFTEHDSEHRIDAERRSSLFRWSVTTIIAVIGVVVAVYVAAHGG